MKNRTAILFIVIGLATTALFVIDLAVGSVKIPLERVFAVLAGTERDPMTSTIVIDFRLVKAVMALTVGAAL